MTTFYEQQFYREVEAAEAQRMKFKVQKALLREKAENQEALRLKGNIYNRPASIEMILQAWLKDDQVANNALSDELRSISRAIMYGFAYLIEVLGNE